MTPLGKVVTLTRVMPGSAKELNSPHGELPDFSDIPDLPSQHLPKLELMQGIGSRNRFVSAATRAELQRRRWLALGVVALWALAPTLRSPTAAWS